jgi:KUP system potassium uptake protein
MPAADAFVARLGEGRAQRVRGTAVYLTGRPDRIPHALLHNMKHNRVLHERVILLAVRFLDRPFAEPGRRAAATALGGGFHRIELVYGFKESPNVPRDLARIEDAGGAFDPMETSYFLGRERLVAAGNSRMAGWRRSLFFALQHNQLSATEFFGIPPNRVIELGTQMEL